MNVCADEIWIPKGSCSEVKVKLLKAEEVCLEAKEAKLGQNFGIPNPHHNQTSGSFVITGNGDTDSHSHSHRSSRSPLNSWCISC